MVPMSLAGTEKRADTNRTHDGLPTLRLAGRVPSSGCSDGQRPQQVSLLLQPPDWYGADLAVNRR